MLEMVEKLVLRVLIVDDEFLIRWSVAQTLGAAGHVVLEAGTAAAARSFVSSSSDRFDAVLLDYRLPDSNDLALLTEFRRAWPNTPVLLMSAFATADVISEARRIGAHDILSKPLELAELTRMIEQACRRTTA